MKIEADIEVAIECLTCGRTLTAAATRNREGKITIKVDPCEKCLDNAYECGTIEESQKKE